VTADKNTPSDPERANDEQSEATAASGSSESATPAAADSADEVGVQDVPVETEALTEEDAALLDLAAVDLVSEMRSDMLRAQAELVNFRTRVERDRVANRESVIAEVIRSLLPALDDLTRAEKHGDLEGSPLELVAAKIRGTFERYGLRSVGEKGEVFDPHFHEAVVQLPTAGATEQTVADVIDPGYALGERLIRAAKVAVSVPE
jgi:molecular chaperone GrpE